MKKSGATSRTVAADSPYDSAKSRFFYVGVFALKKN